MDCITIAWDWKENPVSEFQRAVEFLAGAENPQMYPHPAFEGSDCYGFIISKRPMTAEEINHFADTEFDD